MLAGPLPSEAAGKFVEREPNPVGCGQVVDLLVSTRRDASAVRQFFGCALRFAASPVEVVTDRAPVYPRVLDDLLPAARHVTEQYANNVIEADHGRLKGRLQTMRGLKTLRSTRVIATGHAFVHNLRHGHYAITTEQAPHHLLPAAFAELAHCLRTRPLTAHHEHARIRIDQRNSAGLSA